MEKIFAIIVDDEPRARRVLKNLIKATEYDIEIAADCSNVPEAVDAINKIKPDVVFLDVQMPTYAGYELVNFFDTINFDIIFVTAYDQYALIAFEVCAIDYLVKPIDRKLLRASLEKLSAKIIDRNKLTHYQTLLDVIKKKDFRKLVIPELGNRRILDHDDIIGIEADGAYTRIYLKDGKQLTTSKNLKYYENSLISEKQFFRCHRSWLVNIDCLERFNRTASKLFMTNNIQAKISRSNYEALDDLLNSSK